MRWVGYAAAEDTWEPASHLSREEIAHFKARCASKTSPKQSVKKTSIVKKARSPPRSSWVLARAAAGPPNALHLRNAIARAAKAPLRKRKGGRAGEKIIQRMVVSEWDLKKFHEETCALADSLELDGV